MIGKKKKPQYKFNAGYLQKEGLRYFIIPAQIGPNGKQYETERRTEEKTYGEFEYEEQNDGKWLVRSGNIGGKENDWLINPPDYGANRIEIPREDIESYKRDENRYEDKSQQDDKRKKDGNLIRLLNVKKHPVPCFYVQWKDEHGEDRVSFGHTGFFRLAYKKTIGDHIPKEIRGTAPIDLTEALFGTPTHSQSDNLFRFASRVFFEDAECMAGQENVLMPRVSLKTLSSPKPTTFQHYLEQPNGVLTEAKNLKHWNSDDTKIRGHKLYWHKDVTDEEWQESENKDDSAVIQAVKPDVKFSGRIRFENLSRVELGALLFVLDLPENHYHKLGMGKPLGLGTIKITPSLFISDRIKRYERLFSEDGQGWHLAEEKENPDTFKEKFEKYMIDQLMKKGQDKVSALWDTSRLKELKAMLDWKNTEKPGWSKKVEYMHIQPNQFKDRKVLRKPTEVVNEE